MRFPSVKIFAIIISIFVFVGVVVLPATVSAVGETALEQQALGKSNALDLVECGGFFSGMTISCIVPRLTYYLLYIPAMGLLALSGYIFDFVLSLSIDHTFINQGFVEELWKIVRDFSNMIFIFILLYTGIQTIFGLGKWQHTILQVVMVALLVNFSMFFTKVVIDAGNILAVGVYEGMGATKVAGIDRPHKTGSMGSVEERTISATLVNAFNPQQFAILSADNKGAAVTIFVVAAVVSVYAAIIFIQASLLFVGRLIAFWFLMAISPFALISMALPKGNIWGWWTNTLISQAFVAPVFLILIYLIMAAIGGIGEGNKGILETLGRGDASGSYFSAMVIPIVVTVMIIYALQRALGVAKGMSGKFGGIGADALGKAMSSFPMGMALGGGASLLQKTVGRRAGNLLESDKLQEMSSDPNSRWRRFKGRTLYGIADKAHTSSFDVRNTSTMKAGIKQAKSVFGVGIDLGKGGGKGGYEATMKKLKEDAKKQAEKMKVTDFAKKAKITEINPEYSRAKEQEEATREKFVDAENAHKKVADRAKNTDEWKKLEEVKEQTNTTRGSFKPVEGSLVKKIEDLKKRQAEAKIPDFANSMQEEIDNAQDELKEVRDSLEVEDKKLADAEKAYNEALNAMEKVAKKELEKAKDAFEKDQEIIKGTEKEYEKWEDEVNKQRREFSARNTVGSVFSSPLYFTAKNERKELVKEIRKGTNKEKKKQDKMVKDMMGYFKEKEKEGATEEKKVEGGVKEGKDVAES